MPLNPAKLGTAYPAYAYEVTRAKIHEYAIALGETDPRYLSEGEDCVAPPTFAACFTLTQASASILGDPELGAHSSLVHGSHRFAFGGRPLRPGDRLICIPTITDISVRAGTEMLTVETDCRFEETDELAVSSEAVIVFLPPDEATLDPEVR